MKLLAQPGRTLKRKRFTIVEFEYRGLTVSRSVKTAIHTVTLERRDALLHHGDTGHEEKLKFEECAHLFSIAYGRKSVFFPIISHVDGEPGGSRTRTSPYL